MITVKVKDPWLSHQYPSALLPPIAWALLSALFLAPWPAPLPRESNKLSIFCRGVVHPNFVVALRITNLPILMNQETSLHSQNITIGGKHRGIGAQRLRIAEHNFFVTIFWLFFWISNEAPKLPSSRTFWKVNDLLVYCCVSTSSRLPYLLTHWIALSCI